MNSRRTLLVLSQVYVPDPASVGQHMADAAAEMVRRGYPVRVLASARGYDNPKNKYPLREVRDGVDIRRLPLSSFGKKSIPIRLLGAVIFLTQALVRGLCTPRLGCILVSTSPPMCSIVAIIIGALRGVPVKYWLMDMNPDQVVALGKATEQSFSVRVFRWMNRRVWAGSTDVVALDRFMAERVTSRMDISHKLHVMPPWPLEDYGEPVSHDVNPFRAKHALGGTTPSDASPTPHSTGNQPADPKFVFMYSGNHGPTNPIKTLLDAAVRLKDDKRLVFMFIGGGIGKKEVEECIKASPDAQIRSLPYQPMNELRFSLSAGDVHLVTVGNDAVGIVHPCKVYGAMAVARPVLLLGPKPCHVSDILDEHHIGWHVSHGDVDGCVRAIQQIAAMPRADLESIGRKAQQVVNGSLSKKALCGRFCDVLEKGYRA
ncbi:MAG: glycosyltransferase family 4 protein [Pyrinomonadaceae bacterium]|nr:glycosyltransferase family 4 protein [Phycisphaerales bacterium]